MTPPHIRKFLNEKVLPRSIGGAINVLGYVAPQLAGRLALRVFTRVRSGRLSAAQWQKLESAVFGRLTIAEHEIQLYRWAGQGPRVLLVHGWQSNSGRWKQLVPLLLSEGFDVYAFDAPGHGKSGGTHLHVPLYAEILRHVREHLDPEVLVGHSVGGMAILFDLFQHPPGSIRQVVTIGSPARFSIIMDEYQRVLGLGPHVRKAIDDFVLRWIGIAVEDFHSMAFSRDLDIPGLLLHDIEDDRISYMASVRVSQSWKDGKLILTRGYGHSMHIAEVNQCIADYLCGRPLRIQAEEIPATAS